MKKKIVLTALCALLMIPFSACGGGGDESTESHNYVKHDAVSATCETAGNAEYYTCSDCDKLFDAAQQEISEIPTIAALGHSYVLQAEKAGTCVDKGVRSHYTCGACDKLFDLNKQVITSIEGTLDTTNHAKDALVIVQTQPTKLAYKAGETFDPTGMVAVYKCENCDGDVIDARYLTYTYQTGNAFALGDTKVTASFNGISFDIAVTVDKAQAEITGVESEYTTTCGQAPEINAVCSIADLEILVKYYHGETEVDASEFVAGNTYTVKVSVAETDDALGAEVIATVHVEHEHFWDKDGAKLIYTCVCGDTKDYYAIDNQIIYVDDADMSIDLSKYVGGTENYTVKSIKQVLSATGEHVDINGVNADMVYTFDVNSYEKTPTQEGEDVVYYTPYDLILSIEYEFADGNVRSITLISKYVEKVIRTAEDLKAVMYLGDPNETGNVIKGHYALAGDIDASGLDLSGAQPCWNAHSGFQGTFNGNGYTISNLTIPAWNQGLFGAIGYGAHIQNVTFENVMLGTDSCLLAFALRNADVKDVAISFAIESESYFVSREGNNTTFENVSILTSMGDSTFEKIDGVVTETLPEGITLSYFATHTVTFDTAGGNAVAPVEVTTGKKVAIPATPVKESEEFDYVFLGWYLDGVAYDFDTAVTGDITLVAQWEEKEKVTPDEVISMINVLPDSVVMPDHVYFVTRIRDAQKAYNDLPAEVQAQVSNYAKLENLLASISGYETVYKQSVAGADIVPNHVHNYTSEKGGSASVRADDLYGNVLTVTSDAEGVAAIHFKNFPEVNKYNKIYFAIRVIGASCDLYLSDGIVNDGWGADWKNTWSMSGFWVNDGAWIVKEVEVSTQIFKSDWALGLRTHVNGVTIEITDIVGSYETQKNTGLTFGNFVDSGATNEHGIVYNFTQGWPSSTDMGAFNQNALVNAAAGFDYLTFWIYNPNATAVDLLFAGDMNSWNPQGEYVTTLAAQSWTQVIISSKIIEENANGQWFVNVSSGAQTAGWQISSIFAVIAE